MYVVQAALIIHKDEELSQRTDMLSCHRQYISELENKVCCSANKFLSGRGRSLVREILEA